VAGPARGGLVDRAGPRLCLAPAATCQLAAVDEVADPAGVDDRGARFDALFAAHFAAVRPAS
jgi:hypothetical protein